MINAVHLHWILDTVSLEPVPVKWFLSEPISQHLNVPPIPGLGTSGYLALIQSVVAEGLMQLLTDDESHSSSGTKRTIEASSSLKLMGLNGRARLALTQRGGGKWEEFANPQWNRFLHFSISSLNSDSNDHRVTAVLASRSRTLLIAYLGWIERLENVDLSWDSLAFDTRQNYSVSYWKRLNEMDEVTVSGVCQPTTRKVPFPVREWQLSLGDWRLRPWQRPDWPSGV